MDFMLHGECVAIGMIKEAEIARNMGHLVPSAVQRLASCIRTYKLPLAVPERGEAQLLMEKMMLDKKNQKGKKRCVLLSKIGGVVEQRASEVSDDILLRVVSRSIEVVPSSKPLSGVIRVPGSKSISNRVLLLAAMGEGECRISGLLHSDDTQVMINALKSLNAATFEFEKSPNPHDREPILVVKVIDCVDVIWLFCLACIRDMA
jgi:pentafunctional AROM polypeptide